MNYLDIIEKKKNKQVLTEFEIQKIVDEFVAGIVPDYAMSSFLMAVCINGMNDDETKFLTKTMLNSGKTYDFNNVLGIKLDKHSTGGVSDTTTLCIMPIMACFGYKFVKMSGRSLGFTGGTIDKLEVFKNINLNLSEEKFNSCLNKIGCAITSQTQEISVADKKMYSLRDVSGTVSSIPLIASSIMSKKLAFNTDCLILDVKFGEGALIKNKKESIKLAKTLVNLGRPSRKTLAIISNMNYPLGRGIGNNLEVYDAIKVLKGEENNLSFVVKYICFLYLKIYENLSYSEALKKINNVILSGEALNKFKELVAFLGGDTYFIDNENELLNYNNYEIFAELKGYVIDIDALKLAKIVLSLGGGRMKKDDKVNNNVGIQLKVNINDFVDNSTVLCNVFAENLTTELKNEVLNCFKISKHKIKKPKLIYKVIK